MSAFVLDSSATIAWFMPDEGTEESRRLLDVVADRGALVPLHWRLEVSNALLVAVRRNRIVAALRNEALDQLAALPITVDAETLQYAWTESLALADQFCLTLYDACYLELAQRRGVALASLDNDLRAAGRTLGLTLLGA